MIREVIDVLKMTEIDDYAQISALGISQSQYELANQ